MDSQPHSRPCSATISSGTRQTTSATAPHQSTRWSTRVCGVCSRTQTPMKAAIPIGTLIRNTQRHPVTPNRLEVSASHPPTTGPNTLDVPKTARKNPW